MEEKQNNIELFLKRIASLIYNNPRINNSDFIYSQMIMPDVENYGQSAVANQIEVKKYYEKLVNEGKSKIAMTLIGSDGTGNYFLYLYNGILAASNCVKLYIPFKKDNLSKCSLLLFDFIEKNDITHQSKIAKVIRNDDVVVRVNNVEDAKMIIDFVNNNAFLKDNLLQVNPFLNTDRGIGLAMDGYKSYNDEVSKVVCSYMEHMKSTNSLDKVSFYSFISYFRDNYKNINDEDLKMIYDVIGIHLASDDDGKTFYSYANVKNNVTFSDKIDALRKCVITTYNKYGYNQVINAIESFKSGNANLFTNTNNVRINLLSKVKPYELSYLMRYELNSMDNSIPLNDLNRYYLEKLGCVESRIFG